MESTSLGKPSQIQQEVYLVLSQRAAQREVSLVLAVRAHYDKVIPRWLLAVLTDVSVLSLPQ